MNDDRPLLNALYVMGQPLLLNALSVPATAYIIRSLGPLEYGQWTVATSLTALTAFMGNMGLRPLFVRAVAEEPERAAERLAEQVGLRVSLAFAAGIVSLLVCVGLRYPPVVLACVAVSAITACLTTLTQVAIDLLQGLQRFQTFAAVNLASGLVLTAASVLAVRRGAGPIGLSVAYLTGPMTGAAFFAFVVHTRHCPIRIRLDLARSRGLLRRARALGANMVLGALCDRVEQLLVPKLVGIAPFGYFSAGSMPADRLVTVPDALGTAFYPRIARDFRRDPEAVVSAVATTLRTALVVCIPVAVLGAFLARPIAEMLFPGRAEVCRDVIRVTIWSVPAVGLGMSMMSSLQACGKHAEAARRSMVSTALSLIAGVVLVSTWGIAGACVSWVARPVVSASLLLPCFFRAFPGVLGSVPFLRILACALAMAATLRATGALGLSPLLAIVAGGLLGMAIYIASLTLSGVIRASDVEGLLPRRRTATTRET